jgi:hypothetical protein
MSNAPDGRHRDEDGRISEKHANTTVGTLRQTYGQNFLSDWRSDAHLGTVRDTTGLSLTQMANDPRFYGE